MLVMELGVVMRSEKVAYDGKFDMIQTVDT